MTARSAATGSGRARDGRHSRWEEHREQRRRHILDAAIAVVESAPPGTELTLQDVADRAGLVRTVVQRHFGGRDGLLRAVQADVLDHAFALITTPADARTIGELISGLVGETVSWVRDHPALHVLVEQEVGDGEPSELARAIASYAEWLAALSQFLMAGFGVELDQRQLAQTRILFTGVIGQVRASVDHWAQEEPRHLSADELRDLLTDLIAAQISRQTRKYGAAVDAETPLVGVEDELS